MVRSMPAIVSATTTAVATMARGSTKCGARSCTGCNLFCMVGMMRVWLLRWREVARQFLVNWGEGRNIRSSTMNSSTCHRLRGEHGASRGESGWRRLWPRSQIGRCQITFAIGTWSPPMRVRSGRWLMSSPLAIRSLKSLIFLLSTADVLKPAVFLVILVFVATEQPFHSRKGTSPEQCIPHSMGGAAFRLFSQICAVVIV